MGLGKTPMYAVSVLLPRVPLFASVPPGPGSEIRIMLGWTVLEKTARSGWWWFRGAVLHYVGSWGRVRVHMRMDMARLLGHRLASGAGHC